MPQIPLDGPRTVNELGNKAIGKEAIEHGRRGVEKCIYCLHITTLALQKDTSTATNIMDPTERIGVDQWLAFVHGSGLPIR